MKELLKIENVSKSFNGFTPVKEVSFSAYKQDLILISGENGAGKTTLINLITGFENISSGEIFFENLKIGGLSPLMIAKKGVVRLYQKPRVFKNLTVLENLLIAAPRNGSFITKLGINKKKSPMQEIQNKDKAIYLLSQFNLESFKEKIVGELSFGQQKIISFCMLAMNGVKLGLLDEPFAGLNPQSIEKQKRLILDMKDKGTTFIIIEHNINQAKEICTRHIRMHEGHAYLSKII